MGVRRKAEGERKGSIIAGFGLHGFPPFMQLYCMSSHHDLKAWQHAKRFAVECIRVARTFPVYEQDRGLADQLRRASTSAVLNIVEGCNRASNRDFRRFLETARTSLDEAIAVLELALDIGYLTAEQFARLEALHGEAARTLYGLLRSINARLDRGEVTRTFRPGAKRPDTAA